MKKKAIIFIHGLTGGDETWFNLDEEKFFKELLLENILIGKEYECYHFNYESNKTYGRTLNFIKNILRKNTKKDLNLKAITKSLETFLEYTVKKDELDELIFIAHSMGGIIAKEYILEANQDNKIKICFFLASPQQGSDYALVSKLPGTSKVMEDLTPNSTQILETNQRWINADNLPKTFYIEGNHDVYVDEKSSYNYENKSRIENIDYKYIKTMDNHTSISKPTKDSEVYKIVEREIIRNINVDIFQEEKPYEEKNQYDEMIFVVKMIAAQVVKQTIDLSKMSYYHFDLAYRELTTSDKKKLAKYSDLIKGLYLAKYTLFKTGKIKDSTELILEIREELLKFDKEYYHFEHDLIKHFEKFGLLHSLANREETIIWKKEE